MNKKITPNFRPKEHNPALEAFLSHCYRRRYPVRTEIIHPGDPADTLYYIIEGSVAVVMEDDDGREIVLTYLNAGEFIGEMGLFLDQTTRDVLIRMRQPTTLAAISYQRLQHLSETVLQDEYKDILFALGTQLTRRLLKTSRKISDLVFLDVTGRVVRALLDLCEEPDAMTHPEGMQIHTTRQEIGRIVGCSREMVGRVFKHLEERGMMRAQGRKIVVFNTR